MTGRYLSTEMETIKKSEKTKLRILESARELFALHGYSGVTMKDICERAGLSRGGLYRYYSSTEDVFTHIIDLDRTTSFNMLYSAVEVGKTADEILQGYFVGEISNVLNPLHNIDHAICEFAKNSVKGKQVVLRRAEENVALVSSIIRVGQEQGIYHQGDPYPMARHVIWLIAGMAMQSSLIGLKEEDISVQIELLRRWLRRAA